MKVRAATARDARTIAEIRLASWRATYAGIVPATILERMNVDRNEAWVASRIAAPEGRITLVVEGPEASVDGYALAAAAADEDAAGLGEVEAIYLRPDARGKGLGPPLLAAAVAALAGAGFKAAVLWVLTDNLPARRFYERAGFEVDGSARMLDFEGTLIEEIRFRRPIA